MAVILKFSIESTTPAQSAERGHQCLIIPFPRLERRLAESAPEKPLKNKRQPKAKDRHGKPKSMKDASNPITPTLRRIEAILTNFGEARGRYVPWDYAAAILRKHTGLDCLDTATVGELQKVMIALERTLQSEQRKQTCSQ